LRPELQVHEIARKIVRQIALEIADTITSEIADTTTLEITDTTTRRIARKIADTIRVSITIVGDLDRARGARRIHWITADML
jgi:hypothetical protein